MESVCKKLEFFGSVMVFHTDASWNHLKPMMRCLEMSGMSDVRLTLYAQELVREQEISARVNAPKGLSLWGLFQHRRMTRRALLSLTSDQLRDIGLSYEQARCEGLKPFWRE
jgi:uncharacterized protein YjiS (DUF1127 family)